MIHELSGSMILPARLNALHAIQRAALCAVLGATPALAADDIFANRPAFSSGDQPAKTYARCDQLRAMSAGLPAEGDRIDLSAVGELTSVRTDGALWYLTMCAD